MTDSQQTEERYPLLFLFLDDGNKASRKNNKGVFFERSRSQGIMSGASAVLTQWPGYISSCGLVTIISIMMVFFCLLMLLASSIKPTMTSLHPRCVRRTYNNLETDLFLVHDDNIWQQNELNTLESILTKYQQCDIELLILRDEDNATTKVPTPRRVSVKYHIEPRKRKRHIKRHIPANKTEEKLDLNINIGAKKLLEAFLERRHRFNATLMNIVTSTTTQIPALPTINDVIIKFPKLRVRNVTKSEFFQNGPLFNVWKNFNNHTLNFAARILRLWENGGITFELPHAKKDINSSEYYRYDVGQNISSTTIKTTNTRTLLSKSHRSDPDNLLKDMIDIGYSSFRNLPEGLVTVDEEGIHMETKTTCHAFFGEALVQLKSANNETNVPELIKNTLKTFCVKGAVDSDYCNNVSNK